MFNQNELMFIYNAINRALFDGASSEQVTAMKQKVAVLINVEQKKAEQEMMKQQAKEAEENKKPVTVVSNGSKAKN